MESQEEASLYQTYFRNYNPALGRFQSIDPLTPIIPGLSPYHFANNNPVVFNDPLGLIGGNSHRVGPGLGNHWSDHLKSPEQNSVSMSTNTWQQFYSVTDEYGQIIEERRHEMAKARGQAPTASDLEELASTLGLHQLTTDGFWYASLNRLYKSFLLAPASRE